MSAKMQAIRVADDASEMKKNSNNEAAAHNTNGNEHKNGNNITAAAATNGDKKSPQSQDSNEHVTNSTEAMPVKDLAVALQELLRNCLSKFDPESILEFRATLNREINSALKGKDVCACREKGMANIAAEEDNLFGATAIEEYLQNNTQISELNAIKRAASARIKMITNGKSYKRRVIKGKEYWYEVYWDPKTNMKKERSIGHAPDWKSLQHQNGHDGDE